MDYDRLFAATDDDSYDWDRFHSVSIHSCHTVYLIKICILSFIFNKYVILHTYIPTLTYYVLKCIMIFREKRI